MSRSCVPYSFDGVLSKLTPTSPLRHSTYVDVNFSKLARNYAKIRALVGTETSILPMVKGNAYGNGMLQVSAFLSSELNVRRLGVASLGEALEIMDSMPVFAMQPKNEIVVFSDTEIRNEELYGQYLRRRDTAKVYPVIGTIEDLRYFLGRREFSELPLFVKLNTGMNRMGLSQQELLDAIPLIRDTRGGVIDHLLQHFATSWFPIRVNDFTTQQYKVFQDTQKALGDAGIVVKETSAANSGAIEQGFATNETYVRPGLMLYGPCSLTDPQPLWNGEQVSTLHTKVLRVMNIRCGECVGYGVNPVREDCVVVLLPVGYADGFLRYYSGLRVDVCGLAGSVHGLVNMDLTAVTLYPSSLGMSVDEIRSVVALDAPVTIWDSNLAAIADVVKTNPYQLMTALSIRIPRRYTIDLSSFQDTTKKNSCLE